MPKEFNPYVPLYGGWLAFQFRRFVELPVVAAVVPHPYERQHLMVERALFAIEQISAEGKKWDEAVTRDVARILHNNENGPSIFDDAGASPLDYVYAASGFNCKISHIFGVDLQLPESFHEREKLILDKRRRVNDEDIKLTFFG